MARKSGIPRQNTVSSKPLNSTDDLPEGVNNLYYTTPRTTSRVDTIVDSDYIQGLNNLDADLLENRSINYYKRFIVDKNGTTLK